MVEEKKVKVRYEGSTPMKILCKSSKGWMRIEKGDELELTELEIKELGNLKLKRIKTSKEVK